MIINIRCKQGGCVNIDKVNHVSASCAFKFRLRQRVHGFWPNWDEIWKASSRKWFVFGNIRISWGWWSMNEALSAPACSLFDSKRWQRKNHNDKLWIINFVSVTCTALAEFAYFRVRGEDQYVIVTEVDIQMRHKNSVSHSVSLWSPCNQFG